MIYVDDFYKNEGSHFGRMKMSHLISDNSRHELLDMATKLGLRHHWIQEKGTPREHFDVSMSVRKKAIELGAKEIGMRELAAMTSSREAPPIFMPIDNDERSEYYGKKGFDAPLD